MAGKLTGLASNFYVGGYDLSGDVNALGNVSTPIATLDVTAINKSAHERLYGLADGAMSVTTIFDLDAGQEQKVLSAMPRTDTIGTFFVGTAIGNAATSINAKEVSYSPTRANDGMLSNVTELQANGYGLEWGTQLTAGIRTDTAATNGSGFDNGAAATNGCQVYIQVFTFSGTDVTITVQSSAASNFTSPQTEATYAVSGAHAATRIVGSNSSVNRYWRAITTTSAGFTSLTFAVMVNINAAAVTF